jgi:hypothetical protein
MKPAVNEINQAQKNKYYLFSLRWKLESSSPSKEVSNSYVWWGSDGEKTVNGPGVKLNRRQLPMFKTTCTFNCTINCTCLNHCYGDLESFQHKEMINIWGDRYTNYPDLIILHCKHTKSYCTPKSRYNYCICQLQIEIIFFPWGTGAWTQSLHLEPLHQPYFCEGFFEMESHNLFAKAGFELRSSWSLPPE